MSLRWQLLAVALLTLVLPWAGWRYVIEMEGVLRGGLEQSLLASATTMAGSLASEPWFDGPTPSATATGTIYAHPLAAAPRIDGYRDDWHTGVGYARELGANAHYRAGIHQRHVYLHVEVSDRDLVYQHAPTAMPYGDRIVLRVGRDPDRWLVLNTSAPGIVPARHTQPPAFIPQNTIEERVLATWVETVDGYAVEMRIPMELLGRDPALGVGVIDVDRNANAYSATLSATWPDANAPPARLIYRPDALAYAAVPFAQPGRRLRITDAAGWILYDGGTLAPEAAADPAAAVRRGFFENLLRLLLSRDDSPYHTFEQPPGLLADAQLREALDGRPLAHWYRRGNDASAVVIAAVPITGTTGVGGALLLELGSDSILTLTNEALVRLLGFTLLASVIAAMGLLGYATLLSLRIRRLATAAGSALGPQGDIHAALPGRRSGDEIGVLARSFSDLLQRLGDYTDYLRSLKGKLAHELRTPLAVVSTSLDNLERERAATALQPYLARIREGADRLDLLISAMSEATAIEQAVTDTPRQPFVLADVVDGCIAAYRDMHRDRHFVPDLERARSTVIGSPDLIAQMLDKLVDNAVSFSPSGSMIDLSLTREADELVLVIGNVGPPLPDAMRAQLFDSLVSVRPSASGGRRHLGLGLYIVALIVRFHHATISARNRADGSGAEFEARFPLADTDRGDP